MARRGHAVSVLTTFPHYPQWRWQEAPHLYRREVVDGVTVFRVRCILPPRRGAIGRSIFDISFALAALAASTRVAQPDVIVAISPPMETTLVAAAIARRWHVPSVGWIKDLPLDAAVDVGLVSQTSPLWRFATRVETWSYRATAHLVVLHPRFQMVLEAKGVDRGAITSIPNWVRDNEIVPGPRSAVHRRLMGAEKDSDFVVLHAGNMGDKQGLANVTSAARILATAGDRRIRFAFIGEGPQRRLLLNAAETLPNVRVLGLQPASEVPQFLTSADALILNQIPTVVNSVVPMKLLSYMAAARPIIGAVHPESVAAEIIREAGAGVLVAPNDPDRLASAAVELCEADPAVRGSFGESARRYFDSHYAMGKVLGVWESLLQNLVRDAAQPSSTGRT